jgi:hypothetical protein
MGAWGEGAFENDAAVDWSQGFFEADLEYGLLLVEQALGDVAYAGDEDLVEADDGRKAVAAAELVAAMLDLPVDRPDYNDAFDWVDRTSPTADEVLVALAVRALDRLVAPHSELAELWNEAGSTSWPQSIQERRISFLIDEDR